MPKNKSVAADTELQQKTEVTMRDVARESGFSPTTVSIALNDAPLARYLPAETKTRIKQAARKLGYRPNPFARSLRSRRSQSIGVMVSDVTDPYCSLVLRGIENTLYERSYVPVFADTHNDPARFERYLEMLLDRRVEGLIIVANWLFLDINVLGDLERHEIPTVVIGRELETSPIASVIPDNEAGASAALEHLYGLGHRDIAFICGHGALADSCARWNGSRSFADAAGLRLDPTLIADLAESANPASGFDGGFDLANELLSRGRRFTALVAFDDLTALGAIRALLTAGVRIPDECSVIGFDDVAAASLCTPPLSTIRQPLEKMGAAAATILIDDIGAAADARTAACHRETVELVIRSSTGPAPKA